MSSVLESDEPDVFEARLVAAIRRAEGLEVAPLPAQDVLRRADRLRRRHDRAGVAVASVVVLLVVAAAAVAIGGGRTPPDQTVTVASDPPAAPVRDHVLLEAPSTEFVPSVAASWTSEV